MTYKRFILPLVGFIFILPLFFQSCNGESDDSPLVVDLSSVAVNGFSLQANAKILPGLDSVFFSIDLERGLIFNADSLPKGTRVDALIPIISLPSSVTKATITMEGGEKQEGEVDYIRFKSDSIDFTGKVFLDVTSYEGNSRVYEIKVNVHTMEPDSLWWGNTAIANLPARLANLVAQRTVSTGAGSVASMILESDGSYTLSTSLDAFQGVWQKQKIELPFTPDVRSMSFCNSQFYMLATDGTLYTSTDGASAWTSTGQKWGAILGAYNGSLIGATIPTSNGIRNFISYPEGVMQGEVPAGFPLSGNTDMHILYSQWWQNPYAVLYGGIDDSGDVTNAVWAYDGSRWAQISNGGLPALTGAALVPYFVYKKSANSWNFNEYSVLMVLGGRDGEGNLNRDMYVSYDNGVHWSKAAELMQMPEYIPGMYNLDAIIATTDMSANIEPKGWSSTQTSTLPSWFRVEYVHNGYDISWECPYIYLYGGLNSEAKLYDSIWRGVIRRLTFVPLM